MTNTTDLLATLTPEDRTALAEQLAAERPTPSTETEDVAPVLRLRVPQQHDKGFVGYMRLISQLNASQAEADGTKIFSTVLDLIERYSTNPNKAEIAAIVDDMSLDELTAVVAQLNAPLNSPK